MPSTGHPQVAERRNPADGGQSHRPRGIASGKNRRHHRYSQRGDLSCRRVGQDASPSSWK